MQRRTFIKNNALAFSSLTLASLSNYSFTFPFFNEEFPSKRPPLFQRTFISEEVEKLLQQVVASIKDPELAWLFSNCYPNTLDTTVDYEIIDQKPDTFIITGDIDAMWLRDSVAQVWPYMPLISREKKLDNLIIGLIHRHVKCILIDPYANAFYKDLSKVSHWNDDFPRPIPGVHERKWEVDSLCYSIRLSYEYYNQTQNIEVFDADWDQAMRLIVKTFRTEQRKDGTSPYAFIRKTSNMIDAPVFDGKGNPTRYTGLIHSMFRPSDDATLYPYLIPSNIFAAQSLRQLHTLYSISLKDIDFANECLTFAEEIEKSIEKFAVQKHLHYGKIYAYEIDGYGNSLFMDDANVPSLLSLAYLNPDMKNNHLYQNTRQFLISPNNPYYLIGKAAQGQGSPHTGKTKIWPMGLILRAITSDEKDEVLYCLKTLKTTHAQTGFMHEAFDKDQPSDYSRNWFAWANTLFGELIIKIYKEHPTWLNDAG